MDDKKLDLFWYWIKERNNIFVKKEINQEPPYWTEDPILRQYKFTNPYRENDYVTRWFRQNIREPLRDSDAVFMATVIFRWFNLPETGEVMLDLCGGREEGMPGFMKFDLFLDWPRHKELFRERMKSQPQKVSGAYIIKTPNGMNKVDGIIWCVDQMWDYQEYLVESCKQLNELEAIWDALMPYPFMGPFMAYEVVTDLRHTALLCEASDIMTWANPGPGAMRGINRLHDIELNSRQKRNFYIEQMRVLLKLSEAALPGYNLEMRDIEHSLCEFDKYSRVFNNEGRTPKARYKYQQEINNA
jgi:hypothetical protein